MDQIALPVYTAICQFISNLGAFGLWQQFCTGDSNAIVIVEIGMVFFATVLLGWLIKAVGELSK